MKSIVKPSPRIIKGQEAYDIIYGKDKDKWKHVRYEHLPYHDVHIYRNKETGEEVAEYFYVGE